MSCLERAGTFKDLKITDLDPFSQLKDGETQAQNVTNETPLKYGHI